MPAFASVLIANRGEIACRVIRACRSLGFRSIAVYSEADAGAPHTLLADQAVCIGPAEARQSYLSIPAILQAAAATGVGAVHPGYGFLSENADFAAACGAAGLVFIGPSPDAIAAMGNKAAAKERMMQAGVPCLPGYQGADQSDARLAAEALRIGLPVMVKAAAGGGGRGMRLVQAAADLEAAIRTARSEAENAFGSGELILEKAVIDGRHVEIQVFGDSHGSVLHLAERDCSVQRRHQKVLEEAPSPAVSAELRARMGAAAVAAAKAIGYVGAGTVEFLLDADGGFYFLEMNTRLQVEHPVTELVTGLDLVALQLRVALGGKLPLAQADVTLTGHAIEARLYAEAPHLGFLPQSGRLEAWQPPGGDGIRVDHGLRAGQEITPHYDAMIAKVIAHGADRDEARRRLVRALEETVALGIETNRGFLIAMLRDAEFAAGRATTGFIPARFPAPAAADVSTGARALAAVLLYEHSAALCGHDPAAVWSSTGQSRASLLLHRAEGQGAGTRERVEILARGRHDYLVSVGGADIAVQLLAAPNATGRLRARIGGESLDAVAHFADGRLLLRMGELDLAVRDALHDPPETVDATGGAELRAPMNGRIVAVLAALGDRVTRGQKLVVLEAMKMQHELAARRDGVISRLPVASGDQVATRQILVELEPMEGE